MAILGRAAKNSLRGTALFNPFSAIYEWTLLYSKLNCLLIHNKCSQASSFCTVFSVFFPMLLRLQVQYVIGNGINDAVPLLVLLAPMNKLRVWMSQIFNDENAIIRDKGKVKKLRDKNLTALSLGSKYSCTCLSQLWFPFTWIILHLQICSPQYIMLLNVKKVLYMS
jgi:hypothetical protein